MGFHASASLISSDPLVLGERVERRLGKAGSGADEAEEDWEEELAEEKQGKPREDME